MLSGEANKDIVRIEGLRKVYRARANQPPKVGVRSIHLGIPERECFGLLGINGAGKTTSIRMLIMDELPSSGTAYLNQISIASHQDEVRRIIGYCPQFDALLDSLTAVEHLDFYARLKGIHEPEKTKMVTAVVDKLGLTEAKDKPAGGYSGGMKRKLQVAIALIGNPPIVFLDEPSTGNVAVQSTTSVPILTTHCRNGSQVPSLLVECDLVHHEGPLCDSHHSLYGGM